MTARSAARQAATRALSDAARARSDARIEDLEWLIGMGESLELSLARLDWSPDGAAITLRRRHHPLAAQAKALADMLRKLAA